MPDLRGSVYPSAATASTRCAHQPTIWDDLVGVRFARRSMVMHEMPLLIAVTVFRYPDGTCMASAAFLSRSTNDRGRRSP